MWTLLLSGIDIWMDSVTFSGFSRTQSISHPGCTVTLPRSVSHQVECALLLWRTCEDIGDFGKDPCDPRLDIA